MTSGQTVLGQAIFTLLVNDTDFGKQLDSAQKMAVERSAVIAQSLSSIGQTFTQIGNSAAGFAKSSANAFAESEASAQRLVQTLSIIGQDGPENFERVNDAIERMSRNLVIDDEVLGDAFSNLAQRTGDSAQALELMGIAADIAAAKGRPLEQVVQAIGRAYQGNERALRMMGIVMDENLTGMEALREAGVRYAGSAEKDAARHGKSWERISIAWENAQEKFGAVLAPTLTRLANQLNGVLDRILAMDEAQLQAWGNGLIWAAGIGLIGGKLLELGGTVMSVVQTVKLYQLAQLSAAQAGTTAAASTGGFLSVLRGIPVAAYAAIAAIIALAAAYNDLRKAQQGLNDAAGMAPGAENLIGTGLDNTGNVIYQREKDINNETQNEIWGVSGTNPFEGLIGWMTGSNARISQASRSAKGAQEKLREIREMRRPNQAPATAEWGQLPPGYGPGHAPGNFSDLIKGQQQFAY